MTETAKAPETKRRRDKLLAWLKEPTHDGLSTRVIAVRCPAYLDLGWYASPYDYAHSDLIALEKKKLVRRMDSHGDYPLDARRRRYPLTRCSAYRWVTYAEPRSLPLRCFLAAVSTTAPATTVTGS